MKKILTTLLFAFTYVIASKTQAQVSFTVKNPANLAGSYNFEKTAGWGALLDTIAITDTLIVARDNSLADSCACEAIDTTKVNLKGKIAVIYRGTCNFSIKATNAQNAGAVGVIIIQNRPDPIFPMGGDGDITIPVIMLSQSDGALLRPAIDSNELIAFMGNKKGLYANDLGFYLYDVVTSRSFAIPSKFAQDNTEFSIPVGSWVYNYGSDDQSNVSLSAIITRGNDTIYKDASTGVPMQKGDSAFISLAEFAQPEYASGFYKLKYMVSADNKGDQPSDDFIVTSFWINDSLKYSKSRYSEDSLKPILPTAIASSTESDMVWCVSLNEQSYDGLGVKSISFNTETRAPKNLIGEAIGLELFKWSDELSPNVTPTFTKLELVGSGFYDYTENLQGEMVTGFLDQSVLLEDGERYLACIHKLQDSLYIGCDNGIDYTTSWTAYNSEAFFPLSSGGRWYAGGFGTDLAPGIIVNLTANVGIKENTNVKKEITAFPNPANSFITIPLKMNVNQQIVLNVFDLSGKLVKSETSCMANNNMLKVNTNSIENGSYLFQLRFEDNSTSNFKVLIAH